jgi:hypothetical protein
VSVEPSIAFCERSPSSPGLEVRINFGMFAGRDATAAEIDDLGQLLLPEVGDVAIVAEQRHELSDDSEVSLHQVRVEVDDERLPRDEYELGELCGRLVSISEQWARECFAARHAEISEL